MHLPLLEQLLWFMNFAIIGEAIFQLMPLFKGKPYGSRRASLIAMGKYGATMVVNMLMANWAMSVWLLIGLLKETCSWVMLSRLKEEKGITI